jgi:hypothetical protein
MANGSGWCPVEAWEEVIVPLILENTDPKANGGWHRTHVVEMGKP